MVVVAPISLMDIRMVEMALVVASPVVPIITKEEEVQVARPIVSMVPRN